jgi:hypothetical protein
MRRRQFIKAGALFVPATFGIFVPRLRAAPPLFLAQNAGAAVASAWTPVSLGAALTEYLNADSVAGSDGDAIGTFTATVGSDATQATAGKKPLLKKASNGINGHNVLLFDGSNDTMVTGNIAVTSAFTMFVIWSKVTNSGTNGRIIELDINGLGAIVNSPSDAAKFMPNVGGVTFGTAESQPAGQANIAIIQRTAGTYSGYLNANALTPVYQSNATANQPLWLASLIDAAYYNNIKVAAIGFCNTAISAGDVAELRGWSTDNYGTP